MVIGSNVVEALWRKGSLAPPWSLLGFQTRFLMVTGGRYYPTAIREHTHDFRKNYTRIATESHKKSTRNYTRITTWDPTENHMKPTAITSVSHAKTLEYVCHTGRTHEPPENRCNPNETKGLSRVHLQVTYVIHKQTCATVVKQRYDSSFSPW